jgi:hypothetical protein
VSPQKQKMVHVHQMPWKVGSKTYTRQMTRVSAKEDDDDAEAAACSEIMTSLSMAAAR